MMAASTIGLVTAVIVYIYVVPWQRNKITMQHTCANNTRLPDLATPNTPKETTAMSVLSHRGNNEPTR